MLKSVLSENPELNFCQKLCLYVFIYSIPLPYVIELTNNTKVLKGKFHMKKFSTNSFTEIIIPNNIYKFTN